MVPNPKPFLLASVAVLLTSGCTDCKAITSYDSVVITFATGAASAPVSICVDHKCYEGDGTDPRPGSPLLSESQLSLKLVGELPSKPVLVEVKAGTIQASVEAKPSESERRGKGCGKTRSISLRYDEATKSLAPAKE
jgi:hypothetical protein